MVIEGNWITGALTNDYPDVEYKVVELPAGPQEGTLQFTNCWGIAADGDNTGRRAEFVEFLTTTEQQMEFAKDFGVMPSLESAARRYKAEFPDDGCVHGRRGRGPDLPDHQGASDVLADLNAQLETARDEGPEGDPGLGPDQPRSDPGLTVATAPAATGPRWRRPDQEAPPGR